MQILYTGANKSGDIQVNPNISVGGYVSSTQLPNDYLGNLFSLVSKGSYNNKKRECKMVALLNETLVNHTAISFTFTIPTESLFKYKFAVVSPTLDDCNKEIYEKLLNVNALPYIGTFTDIVSATVYNIPTTINAGSSIGLWLIREFKSQEDINELDLIPTTCQDFKDINQLIINNQPVPSVSEQETIELAINWT